MSNVDNFARFLDNSPTAFHAIKNVEDELREAGFIKLKENSNWKLENNRFYYVVKNQSCLIGFKIPEIMDVKSINIVASHSDSPCLKIKPIGEMSDKHYQKINVEVYGGALLSTWLDRPLSIAGRVIVKEEGQLVSKLVVFDEDMCIIPNVAIHQNREANSGYKWNAQIDMLPFFNLQPQENYLNKLLSRKINVEVENIVSSDLYLYNRVKTSIWGINGELFSSGRIDNLESVYTSLQAFKSAYSRHSINFLAIFDNEEVGSTTKQGMASSFMKDVIERVFTSFYYVNSDIKAILGNAFMISADNAHAVHPNHPEFYDSYNQTYMNKGVVIKSAASQAYVTDSITGAIASTLCQRANVPFQFFANRSDNRGGSTQAAISTVNLPIMAVDVGCAQLAMHSSYETAGSKDVDYMINFMSEFYNSSIIADDNRFTIVK